MLFGTHLFFLISLKKSVESSDSSRPVGCVFVSHFLEALGVWGRLLATREELLDTTHSHSQAFSAGWNSLRIPALQLGGEITFPLGHTGCEAGSGKYSRGRKAGNVLTAALLFQVSV